MKKLFAITMLTILLGLVLCIPVHAGTSKVCVWVDSESPGSLMEHQTGGSVSSITTAEVTAIQNLAAEALKNDKSNDVVNPCPQTGENIELDVIVGKFHGAYVGSVSTTIQGGKDGAFHVSSNVIAASTKEILARDVAWAYASLKLRTTLGITGAKK
jgi:hypothetical protein